MSMMIHRNRKREKERQSEQPQSVTMPDVYKEEIPEEQNYTRTDINRMTTAELQQLAANEGIENAHNISGEKLKKALIEHFSL